MMHIWLRLGIGKQVTFSEASELKFSIVLINKSFKKTIDLSFGLDLTFKGQIFILPEDKFKLSFCNMFYKLLFYFKHSPEKNGPDPFSLTQHVNYNEEFSLHFSFT